MARELIDYTGYRDDRNRIAHEVSFLEKVPENPPENPPERWIQEVKRQIRERKAIMAGLEYEILELCSLLGEDERV